MVSGEFRFPDILPMTDTVIAYVPCESQEEALRIGQSCVRNKLAACANILPAMMSVYEWKGDIQTDQECLLLLKSTRDRQKELSAAVEKLHSYELCCVIFLPVESGNEPYLEWIRQQTISS